MDIMSRVFLVNEVRLYPPSERRKLIYIHSKLVTSIEADFTHHRMVDKWNQFSTIPVFQSYAEARNWAEARMKEAIAEGYIVAFPERKTTRKQPNPPTWNRKE